MMNQPTLHLKLRSKMSVTLGHHQAAVCGLDDVDPFRLTIHEGAVTCRQCLAEANKNGYLPYKETP